MGRSGKGSVAACGVPATGVVFPANLKKRQSGEDVEPERLRFRRLFAVSESVRGRGALRPLAVLFALCLGACGGGGGGTATGGPSSAGGGGTVQTRQPSLTAGGVTAHISYSGTANISIRKGSQPWTHIPNHLLAAPSTAGWTAATRLNDLPADATERFYAVTDIGSATDNDYLAYGYWSKNKPASLSLDADDFRSFFYGNTLYTGNVAGLPITNTAVTYTGGAAGVYRILGTDSYGHFQANIELRALFGEGGSIRATLSDISVMSSSPAFNFREEGFDAKLSGSSFTGTGPTSGSSWGGKFFGPSGGDATPTGVAGWFESLTSTETGSDRKASLNGSFAANR